MDEAQLQEALDRTVDPSGPRPSIGGLRQRVARRRRRRRTAAGALAVAAAVGIAGAVLAAPADHPARVVTTTPTSTSAPPDPLAPEVGPPTLTIRSLPATLSATGCYVLAPDEDLRVCPLAVPGFPPASLSLSYVPGSATAEVEAAWERGDASAVAQLLGWGTAATFEDVGGLRLLALGETDRVDGSALGLADRVATGYGHLVGDTVVQAISEVPPDRLAEVLDALALEPRWSVLDGALDVLPDGTQVVAQGVRSRWAGANRLPPEEPTPPPGASYGADLVLPGSARQGITIEVTDGIDVAAFIEGLSDAGRSVAVEQIGSRTVTRVAGTPADAVLVRGATQLVAAVDADTLLVVAGSPREQDQLSAVAEQVLDDLG